MQNKLKKILVIGSIESFSLEGMYFRAFKSLKCNVEFFHTYKIRKNLLEKILWKYLRFIYFILIRSKILYKLKSKKNYYDLVVVFKGLYLNKNFLLQCKNTQVNSKWINIFPDNPFNIKQNEEISSRGVIQSIEYFDKFFIFSYKILKKLKKFYLKNNFAYLPFGNDDSYHKKKNSLKKKNL